MCKRQIFLLFVVLMAGVVGSASAAELAVDLACPGFATTAKSGYIIWDYPPGDLWRHDPKTLNDIGGSGINVTVACGYDGDTSMKVLGMQPVGDGVTPPLGTPEGDPIANSWIISHRHWGNNPIDIERRLYWGSVYLRFYGEGLVPGRYRLKSYHNCPNNPADPDWDVTVGNDVMPSIEVFGDDVQQIQGATDVQIQHVTEDNELIPVEIEFEICGTYTGSNPVTVHFESPPGGDDRQGGAAVLNAFILYTASGGQASCPRPLDGAENVCPDVELSWGAGVYAAYHDVYLGTNFTDVSEATTSDTDVYMGQQVAEDTNYVAAVPLDLSQTYYWRIDEVNDACAPYLWKGVVWSFTTNDGSAYNPNPEDGAAGVPLDANLSWTPGCLATSHDVYFGTSFGDVNDANSTLPVGDSVYKGNQELDANEYDPGGLAKGTVYYWRVDELGDSDTWKGQVWSFRGTVDPALMVWYKFDESFGGAVTDYSGYDFHGWVRDAGDDTWEPSNGRYDGCIHFDGGEHLIVPRETLDSIEKEITVCVWVNGEGAPGDMPIFDAGDEGADGEFKLTGLVPDSAKDVIWRAGNDTNDVVVWQDAKPASWMGSWHLFAFVKDENAGTMSVYYDGLPVESTTDANTASLTNIKRNLDPRMFKIGAFNDQEAGYEGRLDDFALYSRALSAAEIAAMFRGGNVALAWGPSPSDGEIEVARDVVLEWKPGDYAVSHEVYFGTNWDDVNDADSSWPVGTSVYKGQQDPCEYAPVGNLDLTATYYWRIDEVNEPNRWKGDVWKFTVANYIIVDDMEDYDQIGNWIYDTWEDGYANWTGAEVTLGKSPWDPVHSGEQSMIYLYINDGGLWGDLHYYSEIERTFADPCNWTEADVKILTLFFDGNSANDATEQMYVGLEDSRGAGSYAQVDYGQYADEDMNDVKKEEWQQWDIALSDFSGVILTAVKKVYIGFGTRGNLNPGGTPGGSGVAYFDDIRLYPAKCVPWRAKPAYDFTNDCKVDLADVGEMADQWLRNDKFIDADEPGTPVVHYKFDETSGSTAYDSNAPYYNGEAKIEDGSSTEAFWETDGRFDGCIRFEHQVKEYCIDMPTDAFTNNITNQITISVWVNWDDPDTMPDETNQLFSMRGGPGDVYKRILGIETSWSANDYVKFWDGSESVTYEVKEVDWSGGWNHYVFVKNVDEEYLRIYLNCDLADESDSNAPMEFPADNAWIGMATDRPDDWHDQYTGLLDDFRVYDYALSEAEIGWLASGGTGYVPLVSAVNIYDNEPAGSKAVNFRDLAELMPSWGEEQFWPE